LPEDVEIDSRVSFSVGTLVSLPAIAKAFAVSDENPSLDAITDNSLLPLMLIVLENLP
jgi:hypothetical protein